MPVSSAESVRHPEYPSVLALSPTRWIVSTGTGSLYTLETSAEGPFTGDLIARYDLVEPSSDLSPFALQAASRASDSTYRVLLTRSVTTTLGKRKTSSSISSFELLEVALDVNKRNAVDTEPRTLDVKWTLSGGDTPFWCAWRNGGWVVLSSETFDESTDDVEETEEERVKREKKEKMEKLGLGATLEEAEDEDKSAEKEGTMESGSAEDKEWPFSWTQTADSVSVSIPLPKGTTRKDISIDLSSTKFTFYVASVDQSPVLQSFLNKPSRQFWTTVDPELSTYTYNATTCVFELDLTKVDVGTRWPSVFSPSEDDDDEEEEVPETLSTAMLAAVRETFSNIKTRGDDEPQGNHAAIPALLREEMDYDLEDGEDFGEGAGGVSGEAGSSSGGKVGREVYVGHIVEGKASWSKNQSSVVSLPASGNRPEIMIKSAVDGLLFEAGPGGNAARDPWRHASTSPALSFVLSSKRDVRLVRHIATGQAGVTVMAFDAGGTGPASGNVYVYYPPKTPSTAEQGVVRVSGGERGAMLGVGEIEIGSKKAVVALCERDLVVLHGVLQ